VWLEASGDPVRFAQDLYAQLRMLDASEAEAILVEDVPHAVAWGPVRDRLQRAAVREEASGT
jgi:L-threonylcarbamoyladenylate synthase